MLHQHQNINKPEIVFFKKLIFNFLKRKYIPDTKNGLNCPEYLNLN